MFTEFDQMQFRTFYKWIPILQFSQFSGLHAYNLFGGQVFPLGIECGIEKSAVDDEKPAL
jgi:hypothetical protein